MEAREREVDKVQGPRSKRKGPRYRWKDLFAKNRKQRRVAARCQGVGKEKDQSRIRVWRLGGLGPVWATLSHRSNFIFFLRI